MRTLSLKIKRFSPETHESRYQEYRVEVDDNAVVLDAIIHVREYQDQTLAVRCSCRSAICGSCAMRINGRARLACKTKVGDVAREDTVTVEPMGNMRPVKDLVTDMSLFWGKVKEIHPWLKPHEPPPEREHIASREAMNDLAGTMNCIMCGCCVSDCTSLEVDKNFTGPAALAKAYRFVGDPREREAARDERLLDLSQYGGIWDCTHCFECVQQCPKDIAPMEQILKIRRQAMKAGFQNNAGSRHSNEFARSVEHSGWVDEFMLPLMSAGLFNIPEQIKMGLGPGMRMITSGKMPYPWTHKPIPKVEGVKQIFAKLGSE